MDKKVSGNIPSLDALKKMIKNETLESGRLASLKLPRDLSLGGTKSKKNYTPNLNVVRNKDKNKHVPVKNERGQKRNADHLSSHKSARSNDKRVKYIQSDSVFSQGMGELKRNSYHSNRGSDTRDYNNAAIPIPKLKKDCWNVNKTEDAALMNELVANGESDSESDSEFDPIVLPLELNKDHFSRIFKIKSEDNPKIKMENIDPETDLKTVPICNGYSPLNDTKPDVKLETHDSKSEPHLSFIDCANTYDEDNPAFSVLQLPSSFLGKIWKDDPNDKNLDYTVWDMPEGQLGKITVRKSGKMEMTIKNTKYVLNGGNSGNVLETLMLFPGEQSIASIPSVVTLGKVSEKFTVTPEWIDLFNRARKNKKFFW